MKVIAIPLILLAATVAVSSTVSEDAFARDDGRYSGGGHASQAASVSNSCLNPTFDSNTIDNVIGVGNCGSTVSQQHESSQASSPITHQTADPTIEVQRATTTQPPLTGTPPTTDACEECFNMLNAAQQSAFEAEIQSTIEQFCAALVNLIITGQSPIETLENVDEALGRLEETGQISSTTHSAINACLARLG